MKRLLIFAVFYLSFAACDSARSQMQFDSVTIQMIDVEIREGSEYRYLPSNVVNYKVTSEFWSNDTLALIGKWTKITFVIDSTQNSVRSFNLSYDDLSGKPSYIFMNTISFSDVFFSITPERFEIYLDQAALDSGKFYYYYFDEGPASGGRREGHTLVYSKSYPTSHVKINFYRSYKLSSPELPVITTTEISLFPNPASNMLIVKSEDVNNMVEVFDQLGREVHIPELSRTEKSVSFNTSSLTPGIYWLRSGSQTQKIVIQR